MPQCQIVRPRSGCFGRRARLDGQGVDVGLHHLAEGGVDGPVPGQRRLADEGLGRDPDGEMASPVAGAFVAGVLVAVVDHLQRDRLQGGLQRGADTFA